jgi:hypothetical protein
MEVYTKEFTSPTKNIIHPKWVLLFNPVILEITFIE